ncbi:MAG: response regulator transcription factor [Novosphingobium sp.]
MHGTGPISISLVCPNTLAREGLRRILNEEEFEVIDSCARSELLSDSQTASSTQIIVIDSGPMGRCAEEIEDLHERFPNARLVALSDGFCLANMVDAFRAGADGYILKEIGCDSLIESLRLVRLGEKVMPSELVRHLPQHSMVENASTGSEADPAELLSEREIETLRCLVLGYANKVIAYRLDISEATVKVHVKAVLRKLMVQNRTQAAIWAVNRGLVSTPMSVIAQSEPAQMENVETDDQQLMLGSN